MKTEIDSLRENAMALYMPGPIRLFRYFTDAQIQAALDTCAEQMTSGAFTSLSGAQKSSSIEWMALEERLQALNLELNIRNGIARPQKVVQNLSGICNRTGNVSIP